MQKNQRSLSADLKKNEQMLKQEFDKCSDVVYRSLTVGKHEILLLYMDGLIDIKHMEDILLRPLLYGQLGAKDPAQWLQAQQVAVGQTKTVTQLNDVVKHVLKGYVAVLVNHVSTTLLVSLQGGEKRSVQEPITESVIRGPREGFTESIRTNTAMLRRKARTSDLKMESLTLGEVSQTEIVIAYLEGIAPKGCARGSAATGESDLHRQRAGVGLYRRDD